MAISDVSGYPSEKERESEREREREREGLRETERERDKQNYLFFKFLILNLVTNKFTVG